MLLINFLFTLLILGLVSFFVGKAIYDIKKETNKYKAVSAYSKFFNGLLEYADGIIDISIRSEYMIFLLNMPMTLEVSNSDKDIYLLIDAYKQEINSRFGNHIPSIKKEIRNKRLEKLLK